MRQTFLGSMVTIMDCPRCHGAGQILETPCHECGGKSKVRKTRKITVSVPAGVDDGTQIRLSGEGEPGENGGPPGNLYIVIAVEPHPIFKRHGSDILLEINVNVAQAVLGDTVMVPTVDGEESVKIDPGTQSGNVVRLKGKGFPRLRSDGRSAGRGDQVCLINVQIPTKLTPHQRALFEELRGTLDTQVVSQPSGKGIFDRVVNFFSGG
jgi:molecular chaperone DnaJ